MCGIIGYLGHGNAVGVVLEGLKRLEYRGYDSAGIAFLEGGDVKIVRCAGKIAELERVVGDLARYESRIAIGHTRWATHGRPSEQNAHPHGSEGTVVVHNGIIENYVSLKKGLEKEGFVFRSETDTEVICHLVHKHFREKRHLPFEESVRAAVRELRGAYALAIINRAEPEKLIGVRKDSPLALGLGEGEWFLASDASAFINHTNRTVFLEDDEMVIITKNGYTVTGLDAKVIEKAPHVLPWTPGIVEKAGYKHFMLKEIHEQPGAIGETVRGRVNPESGEIYMEEFQGLTAEVMKGLRKIIISACGTSWHAGLAGKYMIERMARLPVDVEIASEFRYRDPIVKGDELFIAITQSGETADTLAAQRLARKLGAFTLSVTNVVGSSSAREADAVFFTRSGPEIGVASTKTFTAQLTCLYLLSIAVSLARGRISREDSKLLLHELLAVPIKIKEVLDRAGLVEDIAKRLFKYGDFLFLGRGIDYPIALEGALKLKEISYIHAEGYPAGELKHGPIALVDKDMPALFLVPSKGTLREKILSNIEEVRSRDARIIAVTDGEDHELEKLAEAVFRVPGSNEYLTALIMSVPLQLLAYHIGVLRGCDVDQPRNLAKSVTVE